MSDRIIEVFAETLEVDPAVLSDESSPDNTPQWDSLAAMSLVSMIEDTFEIKLSTSDIMKMRSIGIVRQVLEEKGVSL